MVRAILAGVAELRYRAQRTESSRRTPFETASPVLGDVGGNYKCRSPLILTPRQRLLFPVFHRQRTSTIRIAVSNWGIPCFFLSVAERQKATFRDRSDPKSGVLRVNTQSGRVPSAWALRVSTKSLWFERSRAWAEAHDLRGPGGRCRSRRRKSRRASSNS